MSNRSLAIAAATFVALCGLGLYWLRSSRGAPPELVSDSAPSSRESSPAPAKRRKERATDAGQEVTVPVMPKSAAPSPAHDPRPSASPPPAEAAEAQAIAGALKEGDTKPVGTVDKEQIREAIRSVTPLVRSCFEDAKDRYPAPQKVVLKFTITGQGISGHFTDGEVQESTIVDPWVQSCFLEALTDARFPVPENKGTVTVTYPFRYESTPPDAGMR